MFFTRLLFLATLFWLVQVETPLKSPTIKSVMWQAPNGGDDDAFSVEERQRALTNLQASLRHSLDDGNTVEAASYLHRVGHLQLILNDPLAALVSHKQALDLLKELPAVNARVDNLNGLGAVYLHLGKSDLAEQALNESVSLSEQAGYTLGQAQALLTLSDKQNHDNHEVALATANKALKLWQMLGDRAGLARSYSLIGTYYLAQNALVEAAQHHEQALALWRELKRPSQEAAELISLGFIEYRKGDWQGSISYYTQAQGMFDEKAEPLKMGQISSGLGAAFNENGMPENGLIHFQRALDYYRQTQDPNAVIYATWSLGRTYYLLRNYPQALSYLQQSLNGIDQNSFAAAPALQYLGRVHIGIGEYKLARQYLDSALETYTKAGNPKEIGQLRALIGQVYSLEGQVKRAQQYYKDALDIFIKLSDRVNQAAVLYALGELELKNRNFDVAESYLRQSIDATENIWRLSTSSDLTAAFSATVHERYHGYIDCLMRKQHRHADQALAVRAFELSEFARGRSLAELLRTTQTNVIPGLDPELAKQEKSLRQSLRAKEDSRVALLGREYTNEELHTLDGELARSEAEYKKVTETIRARYPTYQQVTRPTAWDLPQIQETVVADDQTVLLEYSLGADKSYVWAVTSNDIKSYELPTEARINEAVEKVRRLLTTTEPAKSESELSQATRELGQMVLSPVAAELNKRRMIVVADGALHYIPFQILPAPAANDQPLVVTIEVINAPSASILGQLQQETARRQTPTKVLAAFGDPVFVSNYAQRKQTDTGTNEYIASLPQGELGRWRHALRDIESEEGSVDPSTLQSLFFTKYELANLREVAGPETLMVTSFDATREKLASLDLTKYAILHFATHGVLDPKRPENSGLFLSMVNREGQEQNGFVGLQDIYNLHAPVELVVLSACRTGLGKDVRGEGLIGLTRGFMYAGASSVVASLWKVDDEATAELMKQFYANMLQHGMPPASALREAQNSIRRQPRWRFPYYWAAFTLQGESNRVIKTRQVRWVPSWPQITFGLSLPLLLLGLAWYRRFGRARAKAGGVIRP